MSNDNFYRFLYHSNFSLNSVGQDYSPDFLNPGLNQLSHLLPFLPKVLPPNLTLNLTPNFPPSPFEGVPLEPIPLNQLSPNNLSQNNPVLEQTSQSSSQNSSRSSSPKLSPTKLPYSALDQVVNKLRYLRHPKKARFSPIGTQKLMKNPGKMESSSKIFRLAEENHGSNVNFAFQMFREVCIQNITVGPGNVKSPGQKNL